MRPRTTQEAFDQLAEAWRELLNESGFYRLLDRIETWLNRAFDWFAGD